MAKIPFDIKYRMQIESGEYKVETEDGFPATILDWSFQRTGNPYICVKITRDGKDDAFLYSEDGKRAAIAHRCGTNLVIITPEPEMSEFEKVLYGMIGDKVYVEEYASRLLSIARKEIEKEQKPAEWSEEDRRMIQSIITNGCVDDKQEHWLRLLPERICRTKQKWSDEDEKRIKQLIYDTEHIRAEYEKRKKELGKSFNDELIKDCDVQIAWLKDLLRKEVGKENLAEWSKEDNIGWDEAIACVTLTEKAAKNEEELQNAITAEKWLKEIKFKYYVHPVKQEWSAEDEEMLDAMIDIVSNSPYEPLCPREGMIVWLKFLKNRGNSPKSNTNSPSWQPSEEQMEALLKLEETYVLEHKRTQETAQLYVAIKSLREQLLKLSKGEL